MQEATGSMKGQTGLQRVMRFLGFSSDLAVEQRLDNLQPYFSIERGNTYKNPLDRLAKACEGVTTGSSVAEASLGVTIVLAGS
jgi:hypothetical protein